MTFEVRRNHFASTPISFKNYILAKHLHNFRTCIQSSEALLEMSEESAEVQSPVEALREESDARRPDIPVMIANLSVEGESQVTSPQTPPDSQSPRGTSRRRRSLQCVHCEKVFTHRGDLNKHLRKHSGERPFPCPQPNCTKRFSHSSNLRRHVIVHSGDKPFVCTKCHRRFNRKDKLHLHQQTKLCRKRSQTSPNSSSASTSR